MKVFEAIDEIKSWTGILMSSGRCSLEMAEAQKMAIEALEKHTPKKPDIFYGENHKDMLATCPVCNSNVDWTYEGFWRKGNPKYCKWCGQAIDWAK